MRKLTYILIAVYILLSSYVLIELQYNRIEKENYQTIVNDVVKNVIRHGHGTMRDTRMLVYAAMSDFGIRISILEDAAKPEGPDEIIIKRKG